MKHRLFFIGALIILTIALIGMVFWLYYWPKEQPRVYKPDTQHPVFDDISGRIIYTLSPEPYGITNIYSWDLETDEKKELLPSDDKIKFTPKISPDGRYVAYSASPIDFSSITADHPYPHSESLQMYIHDQKTGLTTKISSSTNHTFFKDLPDWSPDGRYILYNTFTHKVLTDNSNLSDITIFMYDTKTKETTEIVNGVYPKWAGDGQAFFYLKNDGLHIMDPHIGLDSDELVINLLGDPPDESKSAYVDMTLGISLDGKKMAWSSPIINELFIYDVYSWYPKINYIEDIHRIKIPGTKSYNPIFSPDDKFLAVKEINFNTETTITIYDLEGFNTKKIIDLPDDFYHSIEMWQWIQD